MAARVLIDWDPATPADFRRALSHALDALLIDHADAADVDADPDAPAPLRLAVATPSGRIVRRDADLVIVAKTDDASSVQLPPNALPLSISDIAPPHRRFIALVERLGQKLHRPGLGDYARGDFIRHPENHAMLAAWSLAFPNDPLAKELAISHTPAVLHEKLAAATSRAEAAERALQSAGMNESDAVRALRRAEAETVSARARIAELESQRDRLTHLADITLYSAASLAPDIRAHVIAAREHAWRARLAAAQAAEAAGLHADALAWPLARYSGETVNRLPHGLGVMTFSDGAHYAGRFENGRRAGHGVGVSDGFTWTGEWSQEASGYGLLETDDGARYEGEVAPDETGAPKRVPNRGHLWPASEPAARIARPVHQPLARALPAPGE